MIVIAPLGDSAWVAGDPRKVPSKNAKRRLDCLCSLRQRDERHTLRNLWHGGDSILTLSHVCLDRQSNEEARRQWSLPARLAPGVVYAIENSYPETPDSVLEPAFKIVRIGFE